VNDVTLVPWAPRHLPLLVAANTAEMTRHLGGPESDEEVRARHDRYLRLSTAPDATSRPFAIEVDGVPAGGIGTWPVEHDGEDAYETGWNVLPGWQGRGVASAAVRELVRRLVRDAPARERLYAFPSVENAASNALCRATGFVEVEVRDLPYRDAVLRTRVWVLELAAARRGSVG
jgi:RimJ/RimL family protein N-acetyltransferase